MLKLSDLALRPDLQLGPMLVSPSRRLVEGPGGHVHLEPLIMQVFLLLLDGGGKVVTRSELFDQCWGGVIVGDDSLNRAILKVRRTGGQVAPGLFEVETIPRTGYRLTGEILQFLGKDVPDAEAVEAAGAFSRRTLVGSGVAAAAVLGGAGLWWANRPRTNPRFETLMKRGEDALRLDQAGGSQYFEQAAALEPKNAGTWGLLAYSITREAGDGPWDLTDQGAQAAESAARKALQLDPKEPNALLTMTIIRMGMLDRYSIEEQYLRILSIAPDSTNTMRFLGSMLHGVGRCRDSLAVAEHALAIEPLAPDHWLRKAMRLWTLGRVADADRVIDRAMQLWPSHRIVRLARLMIYAFTGRAQAALAMLDEELAKPIFVPKTVLPVFRTSFLALEAPTVSATAAARKASIERSAGSPQIASLAILVMSALGELDAAFEIANGFLLDRGSIIVRPRPDPSLPRANTSGWRNTFGLFTPPTKAMRLDPRFKPLADGLGLTDYWQRRGIGPDAFLFKL